MCYREVQFILKAFLFHTFCLVVTEILRKIFKLSTERAQKTFAPRKPGHQMLQGGAAISAPSSFALVSFVMVDVWGSPISRWT
jgi:hypothetical protein